MSRRLSILFVILGVALVACGSDDASSNVGSETFDPESWESAEDCDLGPTPDEDDPEVAADPVVFEVEGDTAIMTGSIGADVVHRVCDLVDDNAAVDTVELLDVPGSSTPGNETLEAGLALNASGLGTYVASDAQIESGGVDLFMAGVEREVDDGACLGVHSTEIDSPDGPIAAADLPRGDPEHDPFLEYYRALGITEDFYWFTLEAAPPSGIHYLTPEEMVRFDVTTGPPPTEGCELPDDR